MKTVYHVGIYCRLSVDDASNSAKAKGYIPADESTSIENQRELLSKFAMSTEPTARLMAFCLIALFMLHP